MKGSEIKKLLIEFAATYNFMVLNFSHNSYLFNEAQKKNKIKEINKLLSVTVDKLKNLLK